MAVARTLIRRLPSFGYAFTPRFTTAVSPTLLENSCFSPLVSNPLQGVTVSRSISQKVLEEEEAKQITWIDWLLEPLTKSINPPEKVISEDEINERQELLTRIQSCYYKKPPEEPGKELFIEAFHMLMKYDDWKSVEALWRLGEMQKHEFEDELIDKIEDYLLDVRQRRWFEE